MVSAVELDGVVKRYGSTLAADAVTLTADKGSFTTLLGPSGCGKTTLLRLIAGLEQPDAGEVRIGGRSMAGVPLHRRNIGLVFQNYALFPHLSVHDNIAFGLRYHGSDKGAASARVEAMLELVRMPGKGGAMPHAISGGQKQRVALARALVIEPEVLLLDEPLSALDANLRDEMRIELRAIQERLGVTTIFVTHDQGEALAMSDTIAVLNGGRLQQFGSPGEIYNRPVSPFVSNFLGQSNILSGVVRTVDGVHAVADIDGLGEIAGVAGNAGLVPGQAAQLVIRAEKLRVTPASGSSALQGLVEAVDYQGPSVRYQVRVGELPLYALAFLDGAPLATGSAVELVFDPEDCRIYLHEEPLA